MKNGTIVLLAILILFIAVAGFGVWWQQTRSPGSSTTPIPARGNLPTKVVTQSVAEPTGEVPTQATEETTPTQIEKSGTVVSVDGPQLTLDLGGERKNFIVDEEHPVIKTLIKGEPEGDAPPVDLLKASDIKVGDKVVAYMDENGEVQSIVVK